MSKWVDIIESRILIVEEVTYEYEKGESQKESYRTVLELEALVITMVSNICMFICISVCAYIYYKLIYVYTHI